VCALSRHCQHVVFTFPPSSLWAGEESVVGTEGSCSAPHGPLLPLSLPFPVYQACLCCKAGLCILAEEVGMVMLCLQ